MILHELKAVSRTTTMAVEDNDILVSTLKKSLSVHILQWIEALCLLGELNDISTTLRKSHAALVVSSCICLEWVFLLIMKY
jgi:hypothetical protein